jgi:hypothetical protein
MPIVVCHLACTNFSSNGGDAIEVVHSDSSADVAAADAPTLRGMMLLLACLVEIFLVLNSLVLLGKVLFLYL